MKKTILIAAVMFCALSVTGFAQVNPGASFTVAFDTVSALRCCGIAEKVGDIAFTTVTGTPNSVTGLIEIDYNVPLVSTDLIQLDRVAGDVGGVIGVPPFAEIANIDTVNGVITIRVGAGGVSPYSITLRNVYANVSGFACDSTAVQEVTAVVSSTGNQLTVGELEVTLARSVRPALNQTISSSPAVEINRVNGDLSADGFRLTINEGFIDAFGDVTAEGAFMIRLNVSAVPAGVSLVFPMESSASATNTLVPAGLFHLADSAGNALGADQSVGGGSGTVYYRLTTDLDTADTNLQALLVDVEVLVSPSASFPLAKTPITISAQPAPIGGSSIPRFVNEAKCVTENETVVTFFGATTTLIIPFATQDGYDTGLSVSNTTDDPGTDVMGFTEAVRQAGTITFYFYQQDGEFFTYEVTQSSPGGGVLNSEDELEPGKSYIVLLSQILDDAGESFNSGYVFVVTNFTNAHGQYFVSDFETFSNGALMLVVDGDRNTDAEGLGQ